MLLPLLVCFGGPIQSIKESNQLGVLTTFCYLTKYRFSKRYMYLRYIYDKNHVIAELNFYGRDTSRRFNNTE